MATLAHSYMMAFFDDGAPRSDLSPVGTFTFLDSGVEAAVSATNMQTATKNAAAQVDVVAAARTLTKVPATSWAADGLAAGDWVLGDAFANGGNNAVGKIESITGASSEIITLENRPTLALVDETGSGDEVLTKLVPGVFIVLGAPASQVSLMWDAGVALIGDSRYKFTPTGPGEPYASNPILGAAMSGLAMIAGSVGEAIRAAASTLYTRMEARTFDSVNNKKVVDYIETAYYTDDTFATEVLRLEHTPTYDATSAVLEATSNEKT